MIRFISNTLILCLLLMSENVMAQVGIGTVTPDSSAVLDLYSTEKGFLLPRMTAVQRDLINNPAHALMIYNNTSSQIQINNGSPEIPLWTNINGSANSTILTITDGGDLSTTSTTHELIPGMELTPPVGNYLVLFNGQFGLLESAPISTSQCVIDLNNVYNDLMAIPATNLTHGAVFGNNEILLPGVYDYGAAASLAGTLFIDGAGDTTSIFIIRTGGALTSGAGTNVVLTNGALSRNIFWIVEGAIALAANTIMKGILISHGGGNSAASGSNLEGRMFSTLGSIAFGPGTATIPPGNSFIDFGILSSFIMFTSSGSVSNTDPSSITGDVGTHLGTIAGFENLNGNIYGPGTAPNPVNNSLVTFSIFLDDILLANSSRTIDINTSVISLQAFTNVSVGQKIDIRWHVDTGSVVIGNRILSLIKAN